MLLLDTRKEMLPFIILLILVIFPDSYILFSFHDVLGPWLCSLLLLPSAVTVATLAFAFTAYRLWLIRLLYLLTLCFSVPKFCFASVSLVGQLLYVVDDTAIYFGNTIGLIMSALAVVIACYGFAIGWRHVVTKSTEISFERLPEAFNKYCIVQISDLHLGTYTKAPKTIENIVEKINKINADLVVFTGDLINQFPSEITQFANHLSALRAKDGIMSVLGNHDYCIYNKLSEANHKEATSEVVSQTRRMGWDLLMNEHRIIKRKNQEIAIVGVENGGPAPSPSFADLPKALRGLKAGIFKVLLSHDPKFWRREVLTDSDVDLTLSGHTHAMQLKIGKFTPSKWHYSEWGGLYAEGARKLFVSLGIGGSVAFRFGAWPEINVITLRRGQ